MRFRLLLASNADRFTGCPGGDKRDQAGFTLFDTARAYAPSERELGHNERLLARALQTHPRGGNARVVTKCGMRRDGGAWIPDGRAKRVTEDAMGSVEALGGILIDVLLLHAPDPRVSLSTTARALAPHSNLSCV